MKSLIGLLFLLEKLMTDKKKKHVDHNTRNKFLATLRNKKILDIRPKILETLSIKRKRTYLGLIVINLISIIATRIYRCNNQQHAQY